MAAAASLLVLSAGSVAAAPNPNPKDSGKFVYTEEVRYPAGDAGCVTNVGCSSAATDTGNLIVRFDEGGQRRFSSVDYQLDATVTAAWNCSDASASVGTTYSARNTVIGLAPDAKGRVVGNVALEVVEPTGLICVPLLRRIDYTNVTLTNLNTGHVYRLNSAGQSYPT